MNGKLSGWQSALVITGMALAAGASSADAKTDMLAGVYDGGQTEMAAGLELRADGWFRYGLSYGALDEEAEGSWTSNGRQVFLTSAPTTPPRFVLITQNRAPPGTFKIRLDVPEGMSRQYFHATASLTDGRFVDQQLSDTGDDFALVPGERPVAVRISLPMFDLASLPFALSDTVGLVIHVRFEPNDLGKVAFSQTPLLIEDGTLLLSRHDRAIRFRKTTGQ